MHVVRLQVRDVKGAKFIEIRPRNTVTVVGGNNGAGKSSLLDAMAMVLGGKKLCPDKPIRKGQTKAHIEVELDGDPKRLFPACTVIRDFWLKKDGTVESKLEIVTKEGYRAPSPQTLLGDIVGPLGFDPESFLRMTGKEQANVLRSLVGLDFTALDQEFAELYRERAKVNDQGKRLKVQYDALPHFPDAPKEEVSAAALVEELRKRQQVNTENRKKEKALVLLKGERDGALTEVEALAAEITDLEARLVTLRERYAAKRATAVELGQKYDEYEQIVASLVDADTAEVEQQIADSEAINKQVRANAQRAAMAAKLEAERARSKEMTDKLQGIENQKDELRKGAKWPVPGLGYDDNGVTYNDLPFDQISASEQRRVAVSIACALQPTLKFFFLKDGSLLDDDAKAEFAQLAAEHGCQCFVEVVGTGDEANIVIEGGEVVRADEGLLVDQPIQEPAEEPTL